MRISDWSSDVCSSDLAILISPSAEFIERVAASIDRQLVDMPRRDVIATSHANRGALIQVRDLDEACAIANRIAPDHLAIGRTSFRERVGPYVSVSVGAGPFKKRTTNIQDKNLH